MWNYLFYMAYILEKDNTEFNGTESYVYDLIIREDIKWFPVDKALCISEDSFNEQDI